MVWQDSWRCGVLATGNTDDQVALTVKKRAA
jgi:hypothetical protein